jgi:hypothetical protein
LVGSSSANGACKSRPETSTGHAGDLYVEVTKLALNIANCGVSGYLILCQPHHLLWSLVLDSSPIECEGVTVTAISAGPILAQPRQRPRQFSASSL